MTYDLVHTEIKQGVISTSSLSVFVLLILRKLCEFDLSPKRPLDPIFLLRPPTDQSNKSGSSQAAANSPELEFGRDLDDHDAVLVTVVLSDVTHRPTRDDDVNPSSLYILKNLQTPSI